MTATPSTTAAQLVCDAIRSHMDTANVSQAYLGSVIGMKQPTLSRKLNGEKQLAVDELIRISRALGVPPETFLADVA